MKTEETVVSTRKPELIAWVVIWVSFGIFAMSVVGAFLGVRWYVATASDPAQASLTIISGTVLVKEADTASWRSATDDMVLREGDTIRTDSSSQALVTLFDKSTILLFPDSELALQKLRVSRFEPRKNFIETSQTRGKTRIGVAPAFNAETQFDLRTPQTSANFSEGSYSVDTDGKRSEIRVRDNGNADISSTIKPVSLKQHERTEVYSDGVPAEVQPAARDLISNGDFGAGLQNWHSGNSLGVPEGQDIEGKVVADSSDEGTGVAHFVRHGSKGSHSETYLYQDINQDVSDFSVLRLSLEMKLVYQSLSGGGYMGSEYPLMVRVRYLTSSGEIMRVIGFYYRNEANNRTDNALQMAQGKWTQYTLPDNLMTAVPQPRRILSVEISASGHDYESYVRKVSLVGE